METISIALICSIVSCLCTFLAFSRNKDKDKKEETEGITKIGQEIIYVSKGVDDIKYDVRGLNKNVGDLKDRLVRVEESCKSAHKRIDGFEKGDV